MVEHSVDENPSPEARQHLQSLRTTLFGVCLLGIALLVADCGGGGGGGGSSPAQQSPPQQSPPQQSPSLTLFIGAELDSFAPGSAPTGFNGASVVVFDRAIGAIITNATVTMNSVTLTYNASNQDYEGNVVVAPGGTVTLNVMVGGKTFTASATQFTSYPIISAPASGATWDSRLTNTVTWSAGAPTANAAYGLGVLDAADPNGLLIWPLDHLVQSVPIGTTSFSVPPLSVSGGNRLLVVGIGSAGVDIPNASPDSKLLVGGFTFIPITVPALAVTQRLSQTTNALNGIAWSGTQFVAVGDVGTILTSPDGITWTSQTSGTTSPLRGVVWSGTKFVVVGNTGNGAGTVLTSPDGITWTMQNLSNINFGGIPWVLDNVAWSGTRFVAVGGTQNIPDTEVILTSADGITWTAQTYTAVNHNFLVGVAWDGAKFVAVGGTSEILTSPDGITWTAQAASPSSFLEAVTWSGTQFVAGGTSGAIFTSPDAITWTARSSGIGDDVSGVSWSGTQWIAVGTAGALITSPDGITWTKQTLGINYFLSGVASSGANSVMVGANGAILTLP